MDTDQDKSLEESKTTEGEHAETEDTPPEGNAEEQPIAEETSEEELVEQEAPKERAEEAEKEEGISAEAEEEAEEAAPEEVVEEEKEEKPKKVPEEEEIVEERVYTIPLRRAWISPRKKRAPKAMRIVKSFIERHMKVAAETRAGEEEEKGRLVISNEVNERLWSRGIEKPPRNIRVRAVKDKEGTVTLYLAKGD